MSSNLRFREARSYEREEIEQITDIVRLQRVEQFHSRKIEDDKNIIDGYPFFKGSANVIPGEMRTYAKVIEDIEWSTNVLRRVSFRLAELALLGDEDVSRQ